MQGVASARALKQKLAWNGKSTWGAETDSGWQRLGDEVRQATGSDPIGKDWHFIGERNVIGMHIAKAHQDLI